MKTLPVKTWVTHWMIAAIIFGMAGSLEQVSKPRVEFDEGGIRAATLYAGQDFQLKALPMATAGAGEPAYEHESAFLSEIMVADFPFDAVGVEWEEHRPKDTVLELFIRFQAVAGKWGNWQSLEADIDGPGEEEVTLKEVDQLMPTKRARALQYKVLMSSDTGESTPRVQNLRFHFIDAAGSDARTPARATRLNKKGESPQGKNPDALARELFGTQEVRIISRSEWGADEALGLRRNFGMEEEDTAEESEGIAPIAQELEDIAGKNGEGSSLETLYPDEFEITETVTKNDKGESLYWPREYAKNIKKIIIHHTATSGDLSDPAASMRAIYYYHTVRRGWGDIGYNYLIDPRGNIYEGRAGGERVVAGHTRGYNTGSIGIAVLGNYEENAVPFEVLDALGRLIGNKAEQYDIQVDGFGQFRGKVIANVMGHRDAAATVCPGQKLYDALPVLNTLVANRMSGSETDLLSQMTDKPYEFARVADYGAVVLDPQKTSSLTIQLKNIGTETWDQDTYLVVDQNERAERLVHVMREEGNPSSIGRMKESSVAPGQTATFTVDIQAKVRGGFENYRLTPIFNGVKKTRHYLDLPIYVAAPKLSYERVEFTLKNTRIKAGSPVEGTLKLRNTGNISWEREGEFSMEIQGAAGARMGTLNEDHVAPGAIGTFDLKWVPVGDGSVKERLYPAIKNLEKLKGEDVSATLTVYDTLVRAELVQMSSGLTFAPGERKAVWIELKNTGGQTWRKVGTKALTIGKTHHPDIKVTRPVLAVGKLPAGQIGRIRFTVKAPTTPGSYTITLRPRLGGANLMQEPIKFAFNVKAGGAAPSATPTASTASTRPDQELIRIKLGTNAAESGAPRITANNAFDLYLGTEHFLALEAGDVVEIRFVSGRYQILHDAQAWVVEQVPRFAPRTGTTLLEIKNYDKHPAWNPALNDNRFRGILEVREVEGELTVINELPMEDYLKGIGEVENNAPREKIRTMMILARTYARYYLTEAEKFPGKPYHLSDDPDESQKYLGYGFEQRAPNIVRAVYDTRGQVVTYKGALVKTPYFSSTDGTATKSAREVWGWTDTPYLISVPDPLCTATQFSGHGVGLSGCGATAAAEAGHTYEEIIKYYYPGVGIEIK